MEIHKFWNFTHVATSLKVGTRIVNIFNVHINKIQHYLIPLLKTISSQGYNPVSTRYFDNNMGIWIHLRLLQEFTVPEWYNYYFNIMLSFLVHRWHWPICFILCLYFWFSCFWRTTFNLFGFLGFLLWTYPNKAI